MFDPPVGETCDDALRGLLYRDEVMVEAMDGIGNCRAHDLMQAIPGGDDLLEREALDNFAVAIEGNPFVHGNAEIAQRCAAQLEHLKQLVVSDNAGAATEQLDRRPFIDLPHPSPCVEAGRLRTGRPSRRR